VERQAKRAIEAPAAIRLLRQGWRARDPVPPFGLSNFDPSASAIAVAIAGAAIDVAAVASQLPDPSTLSPGTLVVVLPDTEGEARLLGRLFRARPSIPRAVRGSALLARGYSRIGGDDDILWGRA
jgi:hypothetical protein